MAQEMDAGARQMRLEQLDKEIAQQNEFLRTKLDAWEAAKGEERAAAKEIYEETKALVKEQLKELLAERRALEPNPQGGAGPGPESEQAGGVGRGPSSVAAGWASGRGLIPKLLELEKPDVLFFVQACEEGKSAGKRTGQFFLDPGLKTLRSTLHMLSVVRKRFNAGQPQRLAVISGLIKTGKTLTLTELLPAVLRTYGMPEFGGGPLQLDPPALPAQGTPTWSTWRIDCMEFERRRGLDAFLTDLLSDLRVCGDELGFGEARMPMVTNNPKADILRYLRMLPGDRVHFMLVDEIQYMWLLERPLSERSKWSERAALDQDAIASSRRFMKALISKSPPQVVWVVTGSAMAMLWANLAEAPTNGFDLITSSQKVFLPNKAAPESMLRARELLANMGRRMPVLPEPLEPQHPALLAYLAEQWEEEEEQLKTSLSAFYEMVLDNKVVPELIADLGAVMEMMEASMAKPQLDLLLGLLDPALGVDPTSLHRYLRLMFKPFFSPGNTDRVYVDSPMYSHMLEVMVDDSGQLVRSLDGVPNLRDAYRAKERVRMFGELVWEARKVNYQGRFAFVGDTLRDMAGKVAAVPDVSSREAFRDWPGFDKALNSDKASGDAKKFEQEEGRHPDMELWQLLGWYFSLVRHSLTHSRNEWQPILKDAQLVAQPCNTLIMSALELDHYRQAPAAGLDSGGNAGGMLPPPSSPRAAAVGSRSIVLPTLQSGALPAAAMRHGCSFAHLAPQRTPLPVRRPPSCAPKRGLPACLRLL